MAEFNAAHGGDLEKRGKVPYDHDHDLSDSSSSEDGVGLQIAKEQENEIKYRTCSWQKVSIIQVGEGVMLTD